MGLVAELHLRPRGSFYLFISGPRKGVRGRDAWKGGERKERRKEGRTEVVMGGAAKLEFASDAMLGGE